MDYHYENLGHERFQDFCSSLIASIFPDFQAMPTGQSDAGRDSIIFRNKTLTQNSIVVQVKYTKSPSKITKPHKWVIDSIKEELPKILALAKEGTQKYYLLTNVEGSSFPDTGDIDTVNKYLAKNVPIPAYALWRTDLNRRVEAHPEVKWSYTEILSGNDILIKSLYGLLNSREEKVHRTINQYVAEQYEIDKEVKFQQIELQSKLFSLFLDVPIIPTQVKNPSNVVQTFLAQAFHNDFEQRIFYKDVFFDKEVGSATFLLDERTSKCVNKIVIEGAPGQGKSTICQFLCQLNRVKLLNKTEELENIDPKFTSPKVKLPIKVDLRDVASWVSEINPYKEVLNKAMFESIWQKTMESFLVGHIIYFSKVDQFSGEDLNYILSRSDVLIVFDGFDEIANTNLREEVIKFICEGARRIEITSRNLQIIVTSRPAAFSENIEFPKDTFPHFCLCDIGKKSALEYVGKWIAGSGIDKRDHPAFIKLVNEKLDLPHLRELAKNPMQLAIFVSLLKTRGESLPNKRTELYDSYIDLFFSRESQKSKLVLENRSLIISIHKYLSWKIHSDAENAKSNGRISHNELITSLQGYLLEQGHDDKLAEELFDVLKQRVCAIVSRIQGTYEFEVQPLREYFCAKYLYETAPYCPAGVSHPGTKPERFDAICLNPYWNNVLRFFAGCFDQGELPLLIEKLSDLCTSKDYKYTYYPKLIISQLLSDWVFQQFPKYTKSILSLLKTSIARGDAIYGPYNQYSGEQPLSIPYECGGKEMSEFCLEYLKGFPRLDYANTIVELLKRNSLRIEEDWIRYFNTVPNKQVRSWLQIATLFGQDISIPKECYLKLCEVSDQQTRLLAAKKVIANGNYNWVTDTPQLLDECYNQVLSYDCMFQPKEGNANGLTLLSSMFNPFLYINYVSKREHYYLSYMAPKIGSLLREFDQSCVKDLSTWDQKVKQCCESVFPILETPESRWKSELKPWNSLVEPLRRDFGDCDLSIILACLSAGIQSKEIKCLEADLLHDRSLPLCDRTRYCRLKSGNQQYWSQMLSGHGGDFLTLLMFFTWASALTISKLLEEVNQLITSCDSRSFVKLANALQITCFANRFSPQDGRFILRCLEKSKISGKAEYLLSYRLNFNQSSDFVTKINLDEERKVTTIQNRRLQHLLRGFGDRAKVSSILTEIREIYLNTEDNIELELTDFYYSNRMGRLNRRISAADIQNILENPLSWPRFIVDLAERLYSNKLFSKTKPVGMIASENKWWNHN